MNLGQYVADLISLANEIQKVSANANNPEKIYHLALEAKDVAVHIQFWATTEMAGREKA